MTTRKLKQVAEIRVSNVDKKTVEGETTVRLCNYTDVYYKDLITRDLEFMEATASVNQIRNFTLQAGDILVTKDSETPEDIGVPAYVPESLDGVLCGYHLALIRPDTSTLHPKYVFWSLVGDRARQEFSVNATGVTRFGLRYGEIGTVTLHVRPLAEQRTIVEFLDRETTRIDELISKKRRLIELINLRRAAAVSKAVTQGVDSPELEATGSDVLPALPSGWSLRRLKQVVPAVTVGIVVTPAQYYADEGVVCLRGFNIKPGLVTRENLAFISDEANQLHAKSVLREGDVVVVRTGQAGAASVVPPWAEGGNCVDLIIIRKSNVLRSKFLEHLLNSEYAARQVETLSVGAIQSHFNVGAIRELRVAVPPLDEQDGILERLRGDLERMDRLTAQTQAQVGLLGEHRQALITAAVTGEIDPSKVAA